MGNNSNFWKNRKVLPSITTCANSNWKKKIEEVRNLGLKEVCLFPTCLGEEERKELYRLLKETKIERVLLVHIKGDMKVEELDYLVKNYKTEAFNAHSKQEYPFNPGHRKYKEMIFIENTSVSFSEEEIKNFAGICLDFSHLEHRRLLNQDIYKNTIGIIEKYPCGCNHVASIKKLPFKENNKLHYDCHYLEDLSELDYLKRYPTNYFSPIIGIELENTIEEQLKAKNYIINLLKNK